MSTPGSSPGVSAQPGRAVEPEAPLLPSPAAVGASNPVPEGGDTGEAGTDDLRADRATLVELIIAPYPESWSTPLRRHAERLADAILGLGFRRVAEDPDEVDEIARVVRERESVRFDAREAQRRPEGSRARLVPWPELPDHTKDHYRERVEDVLAALRGGEQQ